ncbi:MAG: Sir2 family NAD-dependent protein deacetylase [Candidatus Erginobacter occultus]|nr:Sir2 family NAD-dependent protein deacetylase [Candidatus Erginobacter occultus]
MNADLDQSAAAAFRGYLEETGNAVFMTGAGISTESGIPDFRSPGGLYSDPANVNVFDIDSFLADPSIFYRFWARFLPVLEQARPNPAHRAIARLQDSRKVTVVTQNIDDLHQRAGSRTVWSVHGTVATSRCLKCGARTETAELLPVIRLGEVPRHSCGGVFKPEVTFFGEGLPELDWTNSQTAIQEAGLLCLVGTSLTVFPAAQLPAFRKPGGRLVIVNRDPTPFDSEADLVIRGSAGEVFGDWGNLP